MKLYCPCFEFCTCFEEVFWLLSYIYNMVYLPLPCKPFNFMHILGSENESLFSCFGFAGNISPLFSCFGFPGNIFLSCKIVLLKLSFYFSSFRTVMRALKYMMYFNNILYYNNSRCTANVD